MGEERQEEGESLRSESMDLELAALRILETSENEESKTMN